MSIDDRIRQLERLYMDVDNRISILESQSASTETLRELRTQRDGYRNELSALRRQSYERGQTVDLDRD